MADNTLPPEGLSGGAQAHPDASKRRAFLRRAVAIGVPVVLATVKGRSVLAQTEGTPSGCASIDPSGWRARTFGTPEEAEVACAGVSPP